MKYVEEYVHEVDRHLFMRGKADVVRELRTLLLDGIEERFGKDAGERDILAFLKEFGSPRRVARRYAGDKPPIDPAFEELYLMIMKIVPAAIALGLTVSWVVAFLAGGARLEGAGLSLLALLGQIFGAALSGIGALTLTFMFMSRLPFPSLTESEPDDWNPEELKGVVLGDAVPSRFECVFTAVFALFLVVLANLWPEVAALAERGVSFGGINLDHTLNLGRFAFYVKVMSVFWILEGVYNGMLFSARMWTLPIRALEAAVKVSTFALSLAMFLDMGLYDSYAGLIGFRLLFLIGTIGGAISFAKYAIVTLIPEAKKRVAIHR